MSEETKKTVEETPAEEPNTAPQAEPEAAPEETAAAPETDEAEKTDGKKKEGFFNKKARELEAVKAKLDAAEKNANQAKDQLLRTAAEYDNFRRRSARERENIYADVRCETLKKFLPVYDSLSRALAQTPDDDPARKGIEGIMNQYHTALNQLGVSEIEAVGKPFDANRHNAVMHIEDDAYGEGVVVEEFEKGFCIGDRVLRYSVVKVAN